MTIMKQSNVIKGWRGVPFSNVSISDAFWRPRLETIKNVTIGVCLDQCEKTNRIANFALAAGLVEGKYEGMYYNDSDVYKVLEGAAYSLMTDRDPKLEAEIDRIIGLIEAAQESDGYLSTYYTVEAPDLKWMDMEKHEMYNGGHLIEAAVAYYQATGKRTLLDVACRMADHYDSLFGPGKRHWAEGHEEIELALVKLYGATGEERYWKLALWLLEERGHGYGVGAIWDKADWGPAYCQDDVPVRDIREVKGHAVRAMYLYTAMADVVIASGNPEYLEALDRVWAHTVERNMYVTGGIGPSVHNEGFTHDYDLPNESAYCETCAAIAMAFWNHRMNLLHGDGKYADVVERELFNGALSGISLSGDRFFYVNPLASKGEHHRVEWFHTSCCPTNLVRFLPAIGQYTYAATADGITVNQYLSSETTVEVENAGKVLIAQSTTYPWNGHISVSISPEQVSEFTVRLRLPGWCRSYQVFAQDERVQGVEALAEKGYLVLKRHWAPGDTIELEMDIPVEVVRSRPEVKENRGRIAFQRGPVVYCLEQSSNTGLSYDDFAMNAHEPFVTEHREEMLGGVTVLRGKTAEGAPCELTPYYAWDNREAGFMQIWLREAEDRNLYR
ncbi:glycoside hydrolase family 127 protein [Paenibacillus sp. YAF4_2]|uniref:glycoside hydrolase family 127 protein n=1 Tax=Paenibacillus sp. YAF4_2 TaxID=3233085 RepID=UPI003F960B87